MPWPVEARRKPTEVQVHVSTGAGVYITWGDGHTSHYDFAYLRELCPCATCGEERRKTVEMEEKMGAAVGGSKPASLPMFKPKPKARSAKAVGHYALHLDFTDGHSTGIYSFEYLREICPCDACKVERAKTS